MKKNSPWILAATFSLLITASGFSQEPKTINFRGETIEFPNNVSTLDWKTFPSSSRLNTGYIGWIQFDKTPTQQVQDAFKAEGMELLEYVPHHTYLFYFPQAISNQFLADYGVVSIIPLDAATKQSVELKAGNYEWWAKDQENILISLEFFKDANPEAVLAELKGLPIQVKETYPGHHKVDVSVPAYYIDALASRSFVKWMDLIAPPPVPEDTKGRSLHRSSNLDSQTGAGRNYTGEGIGVLVRDDGFVGPHIDFQGRITNLSNVRNQSHGDGVAGIMAGAGNLLPSNRGMAAGTNIFVINYVDHFLDYATNNLADTGQVQITNSSYGQGCNQGYTTITREVDKQMREKPHLMHVFSAGNSNGSNCGYGAGSQWGNITGGHKQGKNVIATANVYANALLVESSSRGPAHDGRIKPDITAHGQGQISTNENNTYQTFGGTSGAAPGIAGVSAQLYEAYQLLNNGNLPPAALIKAVLLNTANDAGNEGPDFKFGWGIVNGLQAAKLIEEERYLTDTVSQGETQTHTLQIPENTVQARFMIYWNDMEAAPGANPALVNDLDLKVTTPSNEELLPWVLDPTPNVSNLNLPATTGIDRLNNVEQVLINNPTQGEYTLTITGHNVPMGPQEYFIVYELIEQNLTLTYPIGGESFQSNQLETIHWDATNTTEDFVLSFSSDNGETWTQIATVNAGTHLYEWRAPNISNGKNRIKVTSGSYESISPESFSIARIPTSLNILSMCPEYLTLTWAASSGADSYDVYLLGEKYMELVGSTTETSMEIPVTNPDATFWFAVRAKNEQEGWVSPRTRAKTYSGGVFNCSVVGIEDNVFSSQVNIYPNPTSGEFTVKLGNEISGKTEISVINNLGQVLRNILWTSSNNLETVDVSNLTPGLYFVRIESGRNSVTKKLIIK